MASRHLFVSQDMQSLKLHALALDGSASPLVDGTEYSVQNTGWMESGARASPDCDVYLIISSAQPVAADMNMIRASAIVFRIGEEPYCYTPVAGQDAFVWSPFGETSLGIVEA